MSSCQSGCVTTAVMGQNSSASAHAGCGISTTYNQQTGHDGGDDDNFQFLCHGGIPSFPLSVSIITHKLLQFNPYFCYKSIKFGRLNWSAGQFLAGWIYLLTRWVRVRLLNLTLDDEPADFCGLTSGTRALVSVPRAVEPKLAIDHAANEVGEPLGVVGEVVDLHSVLHLGVPSFPLLYLNYKG